MCPELKNFFTSNCSLSIAWSVCFKFWFYLCLYFIVNQKLNNTKQFQVKEIIAFGIIFIFLTATFGILFRIALYGSYTLYQLNTAKFLKEIISFGFFPMFGSMDSFTKYFDSSFYSGNYSREACLNSGDPTALCPYFNGVLFSNVMVVVYLLIMNMVFFNLIIAAIGYFFRDIFS